MKEYWKQAMKETKKIRSLTGAALLAAMGPVMDMLTININQYLEISFTSLIHAITGYLYGPVLAAFTGGIADIVKYIFKPTGFFFPGFTLNEILVGFVYGIIFYKKQVTLPRSITARLVMTLGINLTLTPLWLSIMYGEAFKVMVPVRLIKNMVMLPVDIFLLYSVLKFAQKNLKKR